MASLKEIKSRIQSVGSTRKITSAMKMVSSAKLRKSQKMIENFLPYENKLNTLLTNFLNADTDITLPLAAERKVERVAIVAVSSNSSLCGAFNSNVIRVFNQTLAEYKNLGEENIAIYPVGKKVTAAVRKVGYTPQAHYEELAEKPAYDAVATIAEQLMQDFLDKKIDKVELIFHHYKSKNSQVLQRETFLPVSLKTDDSKRDKELYYLIEPNRELILNELIPKVIKLKLYAALLDSNASEHAARTMAMQIATDNANDLMQELTLQYNKSRQQAITAELLDITGATFGMQ
ncbi:MAG: F0F1 ATP synthase subunit gamma [Prevotellaceae bacterium]|jgi:F-type H+-transporting ATPase subunit gamma|nr:F0F1 ATP synthase subunit gamma [Prevotellaceae bacterium]